MRTLTLTILFAANICYSQNLAYQTGARSAALAHSSVSIADVWAAHHNQAGLAFLDKTSVAIYGTQRYFISELSHGAAALAVPTTYGSIGMSLNYFGFELYNETKLGLNYARQFGKRFAFGLQLNYHHYYVEEANRRPAALTAEAGVMAKPIEKLSLGFHVFNPTGSTYAKNPDARLPLIARLGARYAFSERVSLLGEVRKNQLYPERYSLGFEYEFVENLSFRTGISSLPLQNSFGLGYRMKHFEANLSYEYARLLGSTAGIGLQYAF